MVERGQTPAGGLLDELPLLRRGGLGLLAQLFQKQAAQAVLSGPVPHALPQARFVAQLQRVKQLAQVQLQALQIRRAVHLAGQNDAVNVPRRVVGQLTVYGQQRIAARHVYRQLFVVPQRHGHRAQAAVRPVQLDDADALLAALVKAAPLGAAGPGIPGGACFLQAACPVDMPQRRVMQTARGQLLLTDRRVGRGLLCHLAVQAEKIQQSVAGGAEALQQGRALLSGIGCAVDAQAQLGQRDGFNLVFCKYVDVFRQRQTGIGGVGGVPVVVAGRDEHRHGHLPQAGAERLAGLGVAQIAVEQIARQQHQLQLLGPHQLRQALQQLPLLGAAHGGLAGAQPLKGRIQVQVGCMEEADRAHVSRTPSACTQRPVSVSISKRQPSSLAGPEAEL